ncbi:serine/threonine protein kinase [Emydomyces testavorans]|uniref:Serine/threonine protein kinase n=1 Tax=Emydomyces testavorans TaxID=2070801 RepID=A0AAF0DLA9_9EURO|nr:serine/threonine protein kinase [Emydomyces testavorans]
MADTILITNQRPGCIAIGQTGEICKVNESCVVKYPKTFPGDSAYNELRLYLMAIERRIYERLGPLEGILAYYGPGDESGAIELAYASQGDLGAYISAHAMPSSQFRTTWIRSLVNAFYHIYSCKVLHQDVKLNNIFVDNHLLKIADFANGAIFPLNTDMETIYMQDPLARVDLLGIGCVIYSIAAWNPYSYDYFEEERWPRPDEVPVTDGLIYKKIIDKCWRNEYHSVRSLYEDLQQLDIKKCAPEENVLPRVDFILWFCFVPSLLFISGRMLLLRS